MTREELPKLYGDSVTPDPTPEERVGLFTALHPVLLLTLGGAATLGFVWLAWWVFR